MHLHFSLYNTTNIATDISKYVHNFEFLGTSNFQINSYSEELFKRLEKNNRCR